MKTTKVCADCGKEKSLDEFHNKKASRDGKQARCKDCNILRVTKWQADNSDKYDSYWRERDVKYRAEGKTKIRRARRFGLTVEELDELLDGAGGVCEICGGLPIRWLVIDHCHESNKVRGVLCEQCNQALGLFKDRISSLQKAIEYLEKHSKENE